ncbi:MAG: tetraacyldisaccharide 4'-kinase [Nitrospiraceae bacterium]|nr:tetraacyldisaccharide 4'-kinase [Nitrospiraceae bacterium]
MWYLAYNILLALASPVILLILLSKKRCRRGLLERLGLSGFSGLSRLSGSQPDKPDEPVLWIHAVSLGEVVAVTPLVYALRRRYPHDRIIVSTVTETGREAVEQRLAGVAEHCYAPLDFPWTVSQFVERLAPRAFLFVETELWPNLLRALHRRNIPAVMVNGRLSSDSFRGYRRIKSFMGQLLNAVTLCLMQSDRDAERIIALGARPSRVKKTGNIKFDQPLPDPDGVTGGLSRSVLGLRDDEELIVAGSTHPVEEDQLLSCYEALQKEFPSLVLLLAPRHIERARQVEASARAKGLAVQRRSEMEQGRTDAAITGQPRVIVLDTRGELAQVYCHAALTFVGGTLVPVGGHNLLEPALWGKPVFFGPHTDHCVEIAALLTGVGGGMQVSGGQELAAGMAAQLRDRAAMRRMGEAAKSVVLDNRGALQRSLDLIAGVLDHASPGRSAALQQYGLFPQWLLHALAVPYGVVVRARAALYRLGWPATSRRLPCRVVSVGNLTVGGTGKTPVVIALVEQLLARGRRVGVLSRGYRRQSRETEMLVSDGRAVLVGPAEAGDEPYLIAMRCPRAVVAVGADRYRLGRWVLERHPIDCFVLDDGFQHLGLHRDADLLLVDVSDPAGLQALVPAGRLREPLSAASRATALLLTRADVGNWRDVVDTIEAATGRAAQPILSQFRAETLIDVATGEVRKAETLAGRTVVAVSGIGNPASFATLLQRIGLRVGDQIVFADHHDYTATDLESVRERARHSGADMIVTTEKDAGKIAPLLKSGEQVWAVRLSFDILSGRERFERTIFGEAEPALAWTAAHA